MRHSGPAGLQGRHLLAENVHRKPMPDRIIAATALHLGLPLVTRDRRLQAAIIQTIW